MRPKRSAKPKLGRLEKISPIDYWQGAADFQNWLSEADTLELLSEALNLQLELLEEEENEDIDEGYLLCCDRDTDTLVLIAAQLETSDAAHLGQLITWAAAEEASMIVWVAAEFSDEQTTALTWLNTIVQQDIAFLGVEAELWRIGKEAMAANFRCVCDTVSQESADAEEANHEEDVPEEDPEPEPLTETQLENLEFWSQLCQYLDQRGSHMKWGTPSTESAMGFAIARAGFRLYISIDRENTSLHTQLSLTGVDAHPHFYLLAHEQELIMDEIGLPLTWDDSGAETCTITCTLREADISIRDHWPDYIAWFSDCLEHFYEAFFERIKQLDANLYEPLPNYGVDPLPGSLMLPVTWNS